MRFASHSTEQEVTVETRSACPGDLTSAINFPRGGDSWRSVEAGCPIKAAGICRPLPQTGKPSCDGSTAEFRVVDLISHHDVSADEKFSGGCYFGLCPAAALPDGDRNALGLRLF